MPFDIACWQLWWSKGRKNLKDCFRLARLKLKPPLVCQVSVCLHLSWWLIRTTSKRVVVITCYLRSVIDRQTNIKLKSTVVDVLWNRQSLLTENLYSEIFQTFLEIVLAALKEGFGNYRFSILFFWKLFLL